MKCENNVHNFVSPSPCYLQAHLPAMGEHANAVPWLSPSKCLWMGCHWSRYASNDAHSRQSRRREAGTDGWGKQFTYLLQCLNAKAP